jgi:hypothetical protein
MKLVALDPPRLLFIFLSGAHDTQTCFAAGPAFVPGACFPLPTRATRFAETRGQRPPVPAIDFLAPKEQPPLEGKKMVRGYGTGGTGSLVRVES